MLDLEPIRKRLEATSPPPWCARYCSPGSRHSGMYVDADRTVDGCSRIADDIAPRDAQFIAHAPADIAALLGEVERLLNDHGPRNYCHRDLLDSVDALRRKAEARAAELEAHVGAIDEWCERTGTEMDLADEDPSP